MTKIHKCKICGKNFELEDNPSMWTPLDQCPICRRKLMSGSAHAHERMSDKYWGLKT